jgi:hypothetical protein
MGQIRSRYPEMDAKDILKKLLGKDVSIDDPIPEGRAGSSSADAVGVTGEQGGRLLACYLYHLEMETDSDILGDDGSAQAWLEKAKPKVLLGRPEAKICVEKALKFLPKLKEAIAAREAEAVGADDDDLDDLFAD